LEARWLSPDPAGSKANCPNDPQSQNRYSYVNNSPVRFADQMGLFRIGPPWHDPFGCSPPEYDVFIDGMEEPPCMWFVPAMFYYESYNEQVPCKAHLPVRYNDECLYEINCSSARGPVFGSLFFPLSIPEAACRKTLHNCPPVNSLSIKATVHWSGIDPFLVGVVIGTKVSFNCALVH